MAAADYTSVVEQLYVSYFGRPADTYGLANFSAQLAAMNAPTTLAGINTAAQSGNAPLAALVNSFNTSPESVALYGTGTGDIEISKFVTAIYTNVLNRQPDLDGLKFWKGEIMNGHLSKANAALAITQGALDNTTDQGKIDAAIVQNKMLVATDFTSVLNTAELINAFSGDAAAAAARTLLTTVNDTTDLVAFHQTVVDTANSLIPHPSTDFTLTNGTDIASANVFNAGLVYTPNGGSRVNALQNEDQLTGTGVNATLNATVGQGQDNGSTTIQPVLKNIAIIHTQFTGNNGTGNQTAAVDTIDLRAADSALTTLTIDRIGALNTVKYDNIGTAGANGMAVSNNAADYTAASFLFQNGALAAAGQTGTLTIDSVNMARGSITIGDHATGAAQEGFETLNLISNNGDNALKTLKDAQLQKLVITGNSNSLSLLSTEALVKGGQNEGVKFNAGNGIANPNSSGLRTIDASGFAGALNLDIHNAVGGHNDPAASGQKFYTSITTGAGNDTFWTANSLAASSTYGKDVLKAGAGSNTLKMFGGSIVLWDAAGANVVDTANIGDVGFIADISGIQHLELRAQTAADLTVNMKAFSDNGVTDINLRNEDGTAARTFTIENIGASLASNGNVVLHHGVDVTQTDVVKLQLADATGASDTVALTVVNDLNTTTTYNYKLDTLAMAKTTAGVTAANGKVENVTIHDNDSESNIVTLVRAADHTGTITLDGGTAGKSYTVNYADGSAPLLAKTIDASAQLSNLFLQVAPAAATVQTVKLGAGSDALLFANATRDAGSLDLMKGTEVITDAGGADVVTAIFSTDVVGKPSFTGIETFQTAATANVAMDLSSTGLTTLNLLSDEAVGGATVGANDVYKLAAGSILKTGIISASGATAVSTLNFAGTNEDAAPLTNVGSLAQVFNGVTLSASAATLAVNINSKAVGLDNATHVEAGAASYTLGQLTAQGATTMNIVVGDELAIAAGATKSATNTTVDNIFAKNLTTLTVTANGGVDLGTMTGNATNNNQTLVDATAVKGLFAAVDIALGDNAQVKLGAGGVNFNGLGSAGKNVTITAGDGVDTITGTAQNDTIITGASNDVINGDRGDNVITSGAGNDTITVADGNNTMNIGSGVLETVNVNVATGNPNTLSTNVVTGNGTVADVGIAKLGVAATFQEKVAVGAGHDLALRFLGDTIQLTSSTLDGRVALDVNAATDAQHTLAANVYTALNANSYLVIGSANAAGTTTVDLSKATAAVFLDYATTGVADAGVAALTVVGSNGNDSIVITNGGANTITGGKGADYIVLSTAAAVDKVIVGDGQSTLSAYDQVYNFSTVAGQDTLALQSTNVATGVVAAASGLTVNSLATTYSITNGVLTLNNGGAVLVGSVADATHISLAQAVALLSSKTTALDAVAFAFDANNNGTVTDATDGTFVFQNTAQGTLVELVGTNGVAAVAGAAGANTVHLV